MKVLRRYQKQAIVETYQWLANNDGNPVVVLPTGAGKSFVIANLVADFVRAGERVMVLAHVAELIEQNARAIGEMGIEPGIFSAGLGRDDAEDPCIVAGIQSAWNKADRFGPRSFLIIDECHLVSPIDSGRYAQFIAAMQQTTKGQTRVIGLTATPYRMGSGYLWGEGQLFTDLAHETKIRPLIDAGFLAPLVTVSGAAAAIPDLSKCPHRGDEFSEAEQNKRFARPELVKATVVDMLRKSQGRRSGIVFGVRIDHCQMLYDELTRAGEIAALIMGNTRSAERSLMIDQFKRGEIRWMVNCGVLTTGFDHPAIDVVAIVRATESCGLLAQMAGRGLRTAPGKRDCLILDYGENILRLGYLDELDPDRPRTKTDGTPNAPPIRPCPECDAFVHAASKTCPHCGFEFPRPELRHGPTAHDMGVLAPPPQIDTFDDLAVLYSVHKKYNSPPNHPKTVRVEYWAGLQLAATEFVCPEHEGPAYKMAWKWFNKRAVGVMPTTAAELAQMGMDGLLAQPQSIRVRSFGPGSRKPPEILEIVLHPIPGVHGVPF